LKTYKEDVDYELLAGPEEKNIYLRIKSGEYKDMVLYYYDVSISEEAEDDVTLGFSYHIMSEQDKMNDTDEEAFGEYLGDLLSATIINGLTDGNLEINAGDAEQDDTTITFNQ